MARRGLAVIFTVLGAAVVLSIAGFLILYVLIGREPTVPSSPLGLTGMATYELFLRGTLDKIDVYPDLHHIGDYKTASNTFTEKTYTAAHREMDTSLNRDLYEQIVHGIAEARHKTDDDV